MPILPKPKITTDGRTPVLRFDPTRKNGQLRKNERLEKRCAGETCRQIDYDFYYGADYMEWSGQVYEAERKQIQKKPLTKYEKLILRQYKKGDKLYRADSKKNQLRRRPETASYIFDDDEFCDHCLQAHYGLRTTHDALDHLGMIDLFYADEVLLALRRARRGE